MSDDVTESLQIALREYLAEVGSSNESRACVLAEELERELAREVVQRWLSGSRGRAGGAQPRCPTETTMR